MDALEKLDVWKRSCRLSVEVYRSLDRCPNSGFKDQITRSALSVPSNIAEGYERDSPKEFSRFLKIAKGSSGEFRTQAYNWCGKRIHRQDRGAYMDPGGH